MFEKTIWFGSHHGCSCVTAILILIAVDVFSFPLFLLTFPEVVFNLHTESKMQRHLLSLNTAVDYG